MAGPDVRGAQDRNRAREEARMVTSVNQLVKEIRADRKTPQQGTISNASDFFQGQKGPSMTERILSKSHATLKGILKSNQDLLKKTGKGLLGGLGGLITVGGLAGYLLTGKGEFLNSMVKGLIKWSPLKFLVKAFDGAIIKMAKPIGGIFSKLFGSILGKTGIGKMAKPIGGIFSKLFGSILGKTGIGKVVAGFTKSKVAIGGIFSKLFGSILGKTGIGKVVAGFTKSKVGAKIIGKFASKSAVKQIPVLGSIFGVIFGIQRFKKGDVVGGLMELASGASGFLDLVAPGAGLALGLAIDGLLMFRDIKSVKADSGSGKKPEKKENRFFKGLKTIGEGMGMFFGGQPVEGAKMMLLSVADMFPKSIGFIESVLPVVDFAADAVKWGAGMAKAGAIKTGSAIKTAVVNHPVVKILKMAWEATTKFVEDPIGGLESFIATVDAFVPGSAKALEPIIGGIVWTARKGKELAGAATGALKKGVSKITGLFGQDDNATKRTENLKAQLRGGPGDPISAGPNAKPKPITSGNINRLVANIERSAVTSPVKNMISSGLRFFNKDVDVSGVEPSLWNNFTGMVSEYYKKTGNVVQLNSAFRSIVKQKELLKKKPGLAAPPGRSLHNYGYALDINSKEANEMVNLGLMRKWGFHQPGVEHGWRNPEPWHIEPKGIDRQAIREGALPSVDTPTQIGDAYSLPTPINTGRINQTLANTGNVPSTTMPSMTTTGSTKVTLDDISLNRLTEEISRIAAANTPKVKQHQTINVDARG